MVGFDFHRNLACPSSPTFRAFLSWYCPVYFSQSIANTCLLAIDFRYTSGRDPKPFPPVKVCKEMVDGVGGTQSTHCTHFKNFCFTAFTILRESANLILNLVVFVVDANIPDIKHYDVHEEIQDKFRLNLAEEGAIVLYGHTRSDT